MGPIFLEWGGFTGGLKPVNGSDMFESQTGPLAQRSLPSFGAVLFKRSAGLNR